MLDREKKVTVMNNTVTYNIDVKLINPCLQTKIFFVRVHD